MLIYVGVSRVVCSGSEKDSSLLSLALSMLTESPSETTSTTSHLLC